MTINLSDLSDAQLGALVRRSMTDAALAKMQRDRPAALHANGVIARESKRLLVAEQEERSAMEAWQRVVVMGIEIPTLVLNEVRWDEVAPNTVQDPYRRALAAVGHPRGTESDPFTWRDCKGIHLHLMGNHVVPDEQMRQAETLAGLAGTSVLDALEQVLNLRPDPVTGTYRWTKEPLDEPKPVNGTRRQCPETFEGAQCTREHHIHLVHLADAGRTFRKA